MTLLVRDEEDILGANLDFHLSQGVDYVIVMDNLSVDGTPRILHDYERRGKLLYLAQPEDDFSQHRWVTQMARRACRDLGADWVINNDADEFWWARGGDLKAALAALSPEVGGAEVHRLNFPPVPDLGHRFFADVMTVRQRVATNALGRPLPPKVCHRAAPDIEVEQGSHSVRRGGRLIETRQAAIDILHFPMRSLRQFSNKIAKGGAAYARNADLPSYVGETWRHLFDVLRAGEMPRYWNDATVDGQARDRGLADGTYVVDDRLKHRLAALAAMARSMAE